MAEGSLFCRLGLVVFAVTLYLETCINVNVSQDIAIPNAGFSS